MNKIVFLSISLLSFNAVWSSSPATAASIPADAATSATAAAATPPAPSQEMKKFWVRFVRRTPTYDHPRKKIDVTVNDESNQGLILTYANGQSYEPKMYNAGQNVSQEKMNIHNFIADFVRQGQYNSSSTISEWLVTVNSSGNIPLRDVLKENGDFQKGWLAQTSSKRLIKTIDKGSTTFIDPEAEKEAKDLKKEE